MRRKMILRMLGTLLALACLLALAPMSALAASGEGTKENPFVIENAAEFKDFAAAVNGGKDYSGQYFILAGDIKLSGAWTPIGTYDTPFKGNFDGNGKTISGLNVNAAYDAAGLFGFVEGASISNLTVKGKVTSKRDNNAVGGIVGWAYRQSALVNCKSTVDVVANGVNANAGSLAGVLYNSTASDCAASGKASASGKDTPVGGAVGTLVNGNVSNCTATGAVSSTGADSVAGGFVGYVAGWSGERGLTFGSRKIAEGDAQGNATITGCTASGSVKGGPNGPASGFAGGAFLLTRKDSVLIDKCTAKGNVTAGKNGYGAGICTGFWFMESGGTVTVTNNTALCASLKSSVKDGVCRIATLSLDYLDNTICTGNVANPKMKLNGKAISMSEDDPWHGADMK